MPLANPSKTWQHKRVRVPMTGTAATDMQLVVLAMKNLLTGFNLSNWQTVGSWNAAGTGAQDGVDRWNARTALQWNTYNTGSYISTWTGKQNAMNALGAALQLQLDCGYSVGNWGQNGLNIKVSMLNGFGSNFAGSNVSPPSATDSQVVWNNLTNSNTGGPLLNNGFSYAGSTICLGAMMTTDGLNTRFWGSVPVPQNSLSVGDFNAERQRGEGRVVFYVGIDTLVNVVPGVTCPYNVVMASGYEVASGWANHVPLNALNGGLGNGGFYFGRGVCRPTGTSKLSWWSLRCSRGNSFGNGCMPVVLNGGPNIWDGAWDHQIVVVQQTSPVAEIGEIPDLYVKPHARNGVSYPAGLNPAWDELLPGLVLPCGGVPFDRG